METLVYDIYELDQFHFDMNLQKMNLESLRSMFLIASHDLRAMYIYILDIYTRLLLYKESLYDISDSVLKEILYIYAPIAAQMGLWQIKEKMEDIAFEMMYPDQYQRVQSLLYEEKELSEQFLHTFEEDIKHQLDTIGISYTVTSRTKHIYSLYKKMILKGLSIDQVYDLFAIRIITQTELDCYKVLTLLHSHFQPDVSRIKDYIAVPKSNGYRSIHTTLTIDDIHKVEVQVRTEEMDREASVGQAAHFIYSNFKKSQRMTDQQRKLHESLNNTLQDIQYGKSSHIDTVFENTIFVTLNKKKIVSVDNGMVLGDFLKKQYPYSYRKLAQPKINKKKQKDSYVLQNGDMIETRFQTGFFITVR
ncbi:MAG: hypothetical protein U9Q15_02270 [Patescibacteria group bacterium]|nr:hypothetical protein [Patescibacteria group bacterium]